MICVSCGVHYKLTKFHNDLYDCEDCAGVVIELEHDEISQIVDGLVNRSCRTQPHIVDPEDDN